MKFKVTSDFALLDVKFGRKKLAKVFKGKPRIRPRNSSPRIPVTITGYVIDRWGPDDGTSIEFQVDVQGLELGEVE
jgi:hypothetical protein